MTLIEQIIEKMKERVEGHDHSDIALICLFEEYKDTITESKLLEEDLKLMSRGEYFHAFIRKYGLTDNSNIDGVIWHTLHASNVFFDLWNDMTEDLS